MYFLQNERLCEQKKAEIGWGMTVLPCAASMLELQMLVRAKDNRHWTSGGLAFELKESGIVVRIFYKMNVVANK